MRILCISDIHGNYPALKAVSDHFQESFDLILNGGDTTVYGPFPNETIHWLRKNSALSILGNTDRHIRTLMSGRTFKKPGKAEKRLMYGWTVAELDPENKIWLWNQPLYRTVRIDRAASPLKKDLLLGMYHGSPDDPDEFLFADTPEKRFRAIADKNHHHIITVGHSHSPFHKKIGGIHFVNPGSTGRMFDGNPQASCALITLGTAVKVEHFRIPYPVELVIEKLDEQRLPLLYQEMYRLGRKLN
ncbi:MAG: metallophosphoesterase family protein [Desulfocapsaceae bacterium]|jgi:predicted phosphodiesterase|nr:metallophosphoesterase family protein [Desulfocapsaceae bacterium]